MEKSTWRSADPPTIGVDDVDDDPIDFDQRRRMGPRQQKNVPSRKGTFVDGNDVRSPPENSSTATTLRSPYADDENHGGNDDSDYFSLDSVCFISSSSRSTNKINIANSQLLRIHRRALRLRQKQSRKQCGTKPDPRQRLHRRMNTTTRRFQMRYTIPKAKERLDLT